MKKIQSVLAATLGLVLLGGSMQSATAARFTMSPPAQMNIGHGQAVTLYVQNDGSLATTPPNGYGLELVGLTLPAGVTLLSTMPATTSPQLSIQVLFSGYGVQDIKYDIREIPYRDEYYALWTGVNSSYTPLTAGATDSNWVANDPIRQSDSLPATLYASASGPALAIDGSNCTTTLTLSTFGKALTSPGSPSGNACLHTQAVPLHWEHVVTNITFNRSGGINIATTPDLFNWSYSVVADDGLSLVTNGTTTSLTGTPTLTGAILNLVPGANTVNAIVHDTGMALSLFQIVPNLTDEGDGVAAPNDLCPDTPPGYDVLDTGIAGCGIYLAASNPQLSFKLNGPAAPVPVNSWFMLLTLLSGLLLTATGFSKRAFRR